MCLWKLFKPHNTFTIGLRVLFQPPLQWASSLSIAPHSYKIHGYSFTAKEASGNAVLSVNIKAKGVLPALHY